MIVLIGIVLAAACAAAKPIDAGRLAGLMADEDSRLLLVDVRSAEEFAAGHIPGANLFPGETIAARAAEFAALAGGLDRPIVVYCRSGRRSAAAAKVLIDLGYTDVADFGGLNNWRGTLEPGDAQR
jgi:rhodanese-related sulfurtransferase